MIQTEGCERNRDADMGDAPLVGEPHGHCGLDRVDEVGDIEVDYPELPPQN